MTSWRDPLYKPRLDGRKIRWLKYLIAFNIIIIITVRVKVFPHCVLSVSGKYVT